MKVYLLQDLKGKGKKGDIIDVSEGYGRNHLIPKKVAVLADSKILAEKKSKDEAYQYHKDQEILQAKEAAKNLEGKKVTVLKKPGATGKLFGSVTSNDVALAIEKAYDFKVDKKKIVLPEIKQFGVFSFKVKICTGVVAKMELEVKEQN